MIKMKETMNKYESLECLYQEISVLSRCEHPNVAKIIEARFDGVLIKELIDSDSP